MPPKSSTNTDGRQQTKKGAKGKNQPYELDSTPPSCGEGVFINKEKNARYEGQWQRIDGVMKRSGTGIYTDSGATYDGHFADDQFNGFGVYTAIDGSVYKGDWKNGLMHGHGEYTWPDKSVYEGEWENGKMHGVGKYVDHNGRVWTGTWTEGNADLENLPIS